MKTKKVLYKLHLWLSLPLGILIVLICLSGATLVFKNEIRNALGMPKVVAPHGMGKAHGMDKKHGGEKVHDFGKHHGNAKQHDIAGKNADAPYGTTTKRDFFSYVTKFHTGLMMGAPGKIIVTYTTLFFVFILLSGIWICLPHNGRQLRKRFTVDTGKGKRKLLYDLHVSLGWWTLLWLLLLAGTGLGFGLKLVPKGTELMTVFHELHIGSWGGMLTKVITFIVSIIGASLPVTGYWLYFKKRRNVKRNMQNKA